MDRRIALKTIAASLAGLCGIKVAQAEPKSIVRQKLPPGEVTTIYLEEKYIAINTNLSREQCINDFAKDAIKRYPGALDIRLKFGDDLICQWQLQQLETPLTFDLHGVNLTIEPDGNSLCSLLMGEAVPVSLKPYKLGNYKTEWRWNQRHFDKQGNGSDWYDATFLDDPIIRRLFYIDTSGMTPEQEDQFTNKLIASCRKQRVS